LNTFTLKAYIKSDSLTGSQTNKLALKLQDATENEPWNNQNVVEQVITTLDQWVDLTFTFNDTASMSRTDVDNIVVQFNGEGNNDKVYAYINDIVGSYTAPSTTAPTPNENLVVTFEGNDINSDDLNLGGTTGTAIVTDPTDSTNKVLKIAYTDGPGWGNNAGFDIPIGMKKVVANTITFDIWSDHSSSATQENGYGYMLKLELPEGSIEKSFKADGAGAWQTVTIDLSNCDFKHPTGNCGGQDNAGNQFTRFLLFHWGGSNPSSAYPDTIYIDNIKYDEGDTLASVTPITEYSESFDGNSGWAAADGATYSETGGYGTAGQVNQSNYAHIYKELNPANATDGKRLDLSGGDRGFSFKIKGPRTSKVFLKLQEGSNYANNHEFKPTEANYTTPGEWQKIVVDATGATSTDKTRIVIFFDIETAASATASDDVFEIDDFEFGSFTTLGINDLQESTITIYPNPSTGMVNITGVEQVDEIRVFTISGQLVKKAENTSSIDLSSEMRGLYMIEIESDGKTIVNRLIKE
jgi:hypothetical protein